jgi:hypothetical protein
MKKKTIETDGRNLLLDALKLTDIGRHDSDSNNSDDNDRNK